MQEKLEIEILWLSIYNKLRNVAKLLDFFNHIFWNSVWPIILNGIVIFYANHVFLEIVSSAEIIFWYGLRNSKGKIFHCCDSLSYDWKKIAVAFESIQLSKPHFSFKHLALASWDCNSRLTTCALTGLFWLLSHVIYLKQTKVL